MGLSLQTSLRTTMKLSPTMRLGVELLALPVNELKEAVKKELDSNPALEGSFPIVVPPMMRLASGGYVLENAKVKGKTLVEHLMSELRMSGLGERELEVANAVVCELDENGMFRGDEQGMSITLETSVAAIEAARKRIMQIDPKGCGARDLEECLLAQIGIVPAAEREEIAACIREMCAGNRSPDILKKVKPYVARMKVAPGKVFEYVHIDYCTPDVAVGRDGSFEIDSGDIPNLRISQKYVEMAKDKELDEETRAYAAERVQRARDFNAALERRGLIMEKILTKVFERQRGFLANGPKSLVRLTEREVAAELTLSGSKCSESTVSRAAMKKFVKTPYGTLPLRKFFSMVDAGPREKFRELLAAVPAGEKVPDRVLAERMAAAGFPISRRTVAAWRLKDR